MSDDVVKPRIERPSIRTAANYEVFLQHLREFPNVTHACRVLNLPRRSMYDWREADPEFAADWDDAIQEGLSLLEREMWRRAVDGYEEVTEESGVSEKGAWESRKSVKKASDSLAMFLARGHMPEKYRERFEHSGPDGGKLESTVVILPAKRELREDE